MQAFTQARDHGFSGLEAAHIAPHSSTTDYRVQNGSLFCADLRTLFDLDSLAVEEDSRVMVSPSLERAEYRTFDGDDVSQPEYSKRPDQEALRTRAARLKA